MWETEMSQERQEMPAEEPKQTAPGGQGPTAERARTGPLGDFIYHQRRAAEEAGEALKALIPPDFRTHCRTAREEFLQSFKVLIDGVSSTVDTELNKMRSKRAEDSESGGQRPSTTGKTKVRVDVS
jgi:hypothetical protein